MLTDPFAEVSSAADSGGLGAGFGALVIKIPNMADNK